MCRHIHKISIHIQIFLPGIGQMYTCSFLVTWWLSDQWKQFFLQQIMVSMVPWWVPTYPEKGKLIEVRGESTHKFHKEVNLVESKTTGHLENAKVKKAILKFCLEEVL